MPCSPFLMGYLFLSFHPKLTKLYHQNNAVQQCQKELFITILRGKHFQSLVQTE